MFCRLNCKKHLKFTGIKYIFCFRVNFKICGGNLFFLIIIINCDDVRSIRITGIALFNRSFIWNKQNIYWYRIENIMPFIPEILRKLDHSKECSERNTRIPHILNLLICESCREAAKIHRRSVTFAFTDFKENKPKPRLSTVLKDKYFGNNFRKKVLNAKFDK